MPASRGFTLVELLVAIAVAAIVLTGALPLFGDLLRDTRLTSAVNQLTGSLHLARNAAVQSGTRGVVCTRGGGRACDTAVNWEHGWMVFLDPNGDGRCTDADDDLLCDADGGRILALEDGPARRGVTLRSAGNTAHRVVFRSRGASPGYMGTFSACDPRGVARARGVVLSATGRLRSARRDTGVLRCP